MAWGIDNQNHDIIGTKFRPSGQRVGNEQLENWLLHLLAPKINFHFHELSVDNQTVILLEIGAAFRHPVQFKNIEYIRIGSYKKKLKDYPEKERELWRVFDNTPFEKEMDKDDRVRACYLHACLRYVQRDFMTNTTLRERFRIDDKNSATASRIIKDTLTAELIRCHDESVGSKARKYLPWWA